MRPEALQFLRDLIEAPSPSGYEGPAARVFREYLAQWADELSVDVSGNVLAALRPGAGTRLMLAGHLDEIGFLVSGIREDGLLSFQPIGDQDPVVSAGQRVWVHGRRRLAGGIARRAVHLLEEAGELDKPLSRDELWLDIGAASREEAAQWVEPGDPVTYQGGFDTLIGSRAIGRGFGNKAGAFVVAEALRTLREEGGLAEEVGVVAVGTVQEEIGYRGAATAAFHLQPRVGLAVDVSHATDTPGLEAREGGVRLGGGPAISRGAYLSPVVVRLLRESAERAGLRYQLEASASATETDATTMQNVRTGTAVGLVGIPLRAMHSPCEVLDLGDVEAAVRLVVEFCRAVTPETDFAPWS